MKNGDVIVQGMSGWLLAALSICLIAVSGSLHLRAAAADSSVFDRLRLGSEVPTPKPPRNAEERSIVKKAEAVPAKRLIHGSRRPTKQLSVPLRGTIAEYVASVVSSGGKPKLGLTSSGFVPCMRNQAHRCVAIVGDPCRKASGENCEGMYLTVVIDVDAGYSLDRSVGGGRYVVENQDDIEDLLAVAP